MNVPANAHPGSAAALALGCTCDPVKNADGTGWQETVPHTPGSWPKDYVQTFWAIAAACPVHGALPEKKAK